MPRLLLVDDNPSIHRIAESLLAGSSVELVCVDSAEAALEKLNGGERFDIALLDTVMPGMDGWQLLDRIRATPALERMPVAMMAGVLDAVDQGRLDSASIQGFLKKPIELRDLNDRVQAILAQSGRAFATVPGARLEGWAAGGDRDVSMFDVPALPEEVPVEADEAESDLLILGPEDLLEEPAATLAPVRELANADLPGPDLPTADLPHAAPDLVLEELDMEGLHGLPHAEPALPMAASAPEPPMVEAAAPAAMEEPALSEDLGIGDLGELPEPAAVPGFEEPALPAIHSVDLSLVDPAQSHEAVFALPASLAVAAVGATREAEVPAAAPMESVPAAASAPVQAPAPMAAGAALDADALVRAIASDPALMDALVKAVVAQAGDKVLREIAWELMPELAAKLKP